jgi:hypothetical protein
MPDKFKSFLRKPRFEAQMPTIIWKGGKKKVLYETDEQYFRRHLKYKRKKRR